jgi:hypothetical protein
MRGEMLQDWRLVVVKSAACRVRFREIDDFLPPAALFLQEREKIT